VNLLKEINFDKIFLKNIELKFYFNSKNFRAILTICNYKYEYLLKNIDQYLTKEEKDKFSLLSNSFKYNYLLGRFTAKNAITRLLNNNNNILDFTIDNSILGNPIVKGKDSNNMSISLTHSDNIAASVAFSDYFPMAIDMEKIDIDRANSIKTQLTKFELIEIANSSKNLMILWTAKEALSKILKTGLMVDLKLFEITNIIIKDNHYICFFKSFPQYECHSYIVNNYIFSVIFTKSYQVAN
jgi:phosphopantetheinyl transferase (holo-ACP synthase)